MIHTPSRNAVLIDDVYVEPFDLLTPSGRRPSACLRRYAAARGHAGREGGWIYRVSDDKPIAQGWWNYAALVMRVLNASNYAENYTDLARARSELRDYAIRRALERQS